jgi:hypothetical protein
MRTVINVWHKSLNDMQHIKRWIYVLMIKRALLTYLHINCRRNERERERERVRVREIAKHIIIHFVIEY